MEKASAGRHPKDVQSINSHLRDIPPEGTNYYGPEIEHGFRNLPEAWARRRCRPPRLHEMGTMKLRPTDNHSARSITRRSLLLGISLMVVAGVMAPAAHAQPAAPTAPTATEQPLRPTLP